jgi:hypothetical protein
MRAVEGFRAGLAGVAMRNISFAYTTDSFCNMTKDVTRRIWKKQWVKRGDHMMGVEKSQGLGKGGKIKRLGEIVVFEIGQEPLDEIIRRPNRSYGPLPPRAETAREGFPRLTPEEFVTLFCKLNGCKRDQIVYRIEFFYA